MPDDICNDLLADIFSRLPPKSIIRLRSLSKYWHSRIATTDFIRNHRLRYCSKNPKKFLIKHLVNCGNCEFKSIYTLHPPGIDQLPLDPDSRYTVPGVKSPYDTDTKVVGSCNGIICFRYHEIIILWNLSIRREFMVPRHPCLSPPTSFKVALGFGFDSITNDYKLVVLSCSKRHKLDENNAYIYSLKTDSWKAIPSPSSRFYRVKSRACLFNGILHWVVDGCLNESSPEDDTQRIRYILTFDMNTHVFGHMLLPSHSHWRIRQLTIINGCLAVVCWEEEDYYWSIKVMKEYNNVESWFVLYTFEAEVYGYEIRVFQGVTNGDIVAYYDGHTLYNFETKLLTKLVNFGPYCFDLEMDTYVESLELLDKERGTHCGKTVFPWTKEENHKRICLSYRTPRCDSPEVVFPQPSPSRGSTDQLVSSSLFSLLGDALPVELPSTSSVGSKRRLYTVYRNV